ncbi:hypothetical protein Pmani_025404 [Petrolisthes manimaculis]|uniref:Uncharacterized protein n=1 Tax=Petrolisthes manimaculis TaxID=1843537 RepID=A0AAE1P8B6_9EUCA|nr:hypothetical protein Pmani_025404 [Petrolisthes manimaculis]
MLTVTSSVPVLLRGLPTVTRVVPVLLIGLLSNKSSASCIRKGANSNKSSANSNKSSDISASQPVPQSQGHSNEWQGTSVSAAKGSDSGVNGSAARESSRGTRM